MFCTTKQICFIAKTASLIQVNLKVSEKASGDSRYYSLFQSFTLNFVFLKIAKRCHNFNLNKREKMNTRMIKSHFLVDLVELFWFADLIFFCHWNLSSMDSCNKEALVYDFFTLTTFETILNIRGRALTAHNYWSFTWVAEF